ncbi:hypothetical protein [Nodularia spumigena]|jgi:hypothetical protein|uniref:hypothetical protein n=1 Tax=Nodularia spumigena TaxID=70799 RepID=UPI00232DA021|nr:hypothetical protein [Nodularia spumigena]MDB9500035.1 hypothetical protein [Nodularia spumigena CS-336/02]
MITSLFFELQSKLQEVFPEAWIDLDFGQLEAEPEHFPLPEHCLLIDISNIEWRTVSAGVQQGNATIRLRNAFRFSEDTYSNVPDQLSGIEKMKDMEKLHFHVQGFSGDYFTEFNRIQSGFEKRDDGRRIYAIAYNTEITDESTITIGNGGYSGANPNPVYAPELAV